MDFESTEDSGSLFQIVQMKLVRRARYCAPIAEGKGKAAEVGIHLEIYDISLAATRATGPSKGPLRRGCLRSQMSTFRLSAPNADSKLLADYAPGSMHDYRADTSAPNAFFFESNPLPGASDRCNLEGPLHEILISNRRGSRTCLLDESRSGVRRFEKLGNRADAYRDHP
jgi:hypothetical protein